MPKQSAKSANLIEPAEKVEKVGWTAFFTAAVWVEVGLPNARRFLTRRGWLLRELVRFGGGFCGLWGHYSITNLFLAARHLGLDYLLARLQPAQVLELAAGFSGRALRWQAAQPGIYLEIDQPGVIRLKRKILQLPPASSHRLLELDLLHTPPAVVVSKIAPLLNPTQSTVIIAEGLTGYLAETHLRQLLSTLRVLLGYFENASLLIDFYLKLDSTQHGRVYWAMLPASWLWKILNAPMQMFLSDAAHVRALVESADFVVEQLYSSGDLARLVGRQAPPVNLYYVAHLKS